MKNNFLEVILTENSLSSKERNKMSQDIFGLPKQRKYPLNDRKHIIKAVQFFKYCPEEDKKELAINTL